MMKTKSQKDAVRRAFTLQAGRYAANPLVTDSQRLTRLVDTINPSKESRVLDVATGPGFVAEAFLAQCSYVVGVDITRAPLEIAQRRLSRHNPSRLKFLLGDVEHLPFAEAEFDIVVSRLAIHHMEQPQKVMDEKARVCRTNGIVAVEDLVTSEHSNRATYQNRFEKIRDPSHMGALSISRLIKIFARSGLEIEKAMTGYLLQDVTTWLANARTLPSEAAKTRALIERDAEEGLSGTRPFYDSDHRLKFIQQTIILVGRKL